MGFGLMGLLRLSLENEFVPDYDGVKGLHFPQRLPIKLVGLCFVNSLVKLMIPLLLEQTYSAISNSQSGSNSYLTLISIVIIAIAASQLILIAYTLVLTLYRLNVKRELSMRILENNFKDYSRTLQTTFMSDKVQRFNMDLRIKISTKLSAYIHNYYESYLSLIFQCFNIVVIFIYLLYKLSFSLFFGVGIAGLVMYKTIVTAAEMNVIRFENIQLRARRLKVLQAFFNQLTQFKMCWLDKWIHDKIRSIETEFLKGLRKIKMLDCWCVALWQFTSVGISSIVITTYFLLGLHKNIDKDSVFTPSTFVYLLGMLNFPLNALSWYIAGIKTAQRAISEIRQDVKLQQQLRPGYKKIESINGSYVIAEPLQLQLQIQENGNGTKEIKRIILPRQEIVKNRVYSVKGKYPQRFMEKLVFLLDESVNRGFVQENAWLSASPLQSIKMEQNLTKLSPQDQNDILKLMQIFQCSDIPLSTNTSNYSGGEKLRISLVRAFYLGQFIIINTNLKSLDAKMQSKVKANIVKLVKKGLKEFSKDYTIFIRDNQDIADFAVQLDEKGDRIDVIFSRLKETHGTAQIKEPESVQISKQLMKYKQSIKSTLEAAEKKVTGRRRRYSVEKLSELDKMKQKSIVSWTTFRVYYKSKKHIVFLVSLLLVTILSNYYNYYVNTYINLSQCSNQQIIVLVGLTLSFAFGLFFRSYFFAAANLDEAERICHSVNKNILMNELSYYNSSPKIAQDEEQSNSRHKLICVLTSDSQTIADKFPFDTNIFANNIVVILSSMIVICIQVPPVLVIMVFLVLYANRLNTISHKKDEFLKIAMKEKDVDVYRVISEIQDGKKYLVIHRKVKQFSQLFSRYHEELYSIDWLNQKFKNYINLKYKLVMIFFLIIAVALYSFMNVFGKEEDLINQGEIASVKSQSSSGLALLIQYTIQLSNYLLFFTMSIWDIKGQAVSIQRAKLFIDETASIKQRIQACDKMIAKMTDQSQSSMKKGDKLLQIDNLDFAYQANPDTLIFKRLNLRINKGDKIVIKGRSGAGKTTLYKLLSSAYPQIATYIQSPFPIYFSPQHPLILPDTTTVAQNLNPYHKPGYEQQLAPYLPRFQLEPTMHLSDLNYQQKIAINNLRAFLYGEQGIVIYDEPQLVIEDKVDLTYLIVTHHHEFKHTKGLLLQNMELKAV